MRRPGGHFRDRRGETSRAELNVPFLGEVPLFTDLRILADEGRLAEAVDHPAAKPYLAGICHTLVAGLAEERRRRPRLPTLPVIG